LEDRFRRPLGEHLDREPCHYLGMPRSTVYKLKSAAGTLRQDELTRISFLVGIYKALHILLPDDLADRWVSQPNDNPLFRGQMPVDFMVRAGIPGLQHVRIFRILIAGRSQVRWFSQKEPLKEH
jgi:hypothetical protein